MKARILLFALALALGIAPAYSQKGLKKLITTQEWMQAHLNDDDLVILHVGSKASYDEGHIEGAQLMGRTAFARTVGNLHWELPEKEAFADTLRNYGITNKSKIVIVHGGNGHAPGFRLYFTLDYFGLSKQASILNGGMKGWKANSLPTTKEPFQVQASPEKGLKLKPNASIKVDKEYVKANSLSDKINVIDARRTNFYQGTEETREHYQRSGHVAGAENICWLDIVDDNLFIKDSDTLLAYFQEAGVDKKQEVVAYCHVGLRASVIYSMAKALGFKARLYDGSYNEWDTLSEDYPVKTGKESN